MVDSTQLVQLKNELRDRGVSAVDIGAVYEFKNSAIMEESRANLNIYYICHSVLECRD